MLNFERFGIHKKIPPLPLTTQTSGSLFCSISRLWTMLSPRRHMPNHAGTSRNVSLNRKCSRTTRSSGGCLICLDSSPGKIRCVSILVPALLAPLQTWRSALVVINLAMIRRSSQSPMARKRSLERSSQRSLSAHSSSLNGRAPKWLRKCSTGGTRLVTS